MRNVTILRAFFISISISLNLITPNAQIARWAFTSSNIGTDSYGVTAGTAVRAPGIISTTGSCNGTTFTSRSFFEGNWNDPNPTNEADGSSDDKYVEFPITAHLGFYTIVSSISMVTTHSPTGPLLLLFMRTRLNLHRFTT